MNNAIMEPKKIIKLKRDDNVSNNHPAEQSGSHSQNLHNLGWFYYKYYYKDLYEGDGQNDFKGKNETLLNYKLPEMTEKLSIEKLSTGFPLQTVYPGLIIGTGVTHESGSKKEDEFKFGLSFDHSTGIPVLPGSSVKGLLRNAFPNSVKPKKKKADEESFNDRYRNPRRDYIRSLLQKDSTFDVDTLEREIFEGINKEGKTIPVYERDIFFDAYPIEAKSFLLGSDYITPHKEALKNPLPIQFIKIMPQVTFQFNFSLKKGSLVSIEAKKNLFKQILLDFGIGAKTNVGYGQFSEVK